MSERRIIRFDFVGSKAYGYIKFGVIRTRIQSTQYIINIDRAVVGFSRTCKNPKSVTSVFVVGGRTFSRSPVVAGREGRNDILAGSIIREDSRARGDPVRLESVSVGAWEHSRETIPRGNGQRDLAGAAAEGKQLQLATSAIACHMRFAPPDPGNGSGDCPLFCKLCRTEVNEKTTKPRTFSPGNITATISARAINGNGKRDRDEYPRYRRGASSDS